MPRSGAWRTWPIHNPGLMDELCQRVQFEINQRDDTVYMFTIGYLHFWFSKQDYMLQRFVGPETWQKVVIVKGELGTRFSLDWGAEEDARYAAGVLRKHQILEDIARV